MEPEKNPELLNTYLTYKFQVYKVFCEQQRRYTVAHLGSSPAATAGQIHQLIRIPAGCRNADHGGSRIRAKNIQIPDNHKREHVQLYIIHTRTYNEEVKRENKCFNCFRTAVAHAFYGCII